MCLAVVHLQDSGNWVWSLGGEDPCDALQLRSQAEVSRAEKGCLVGKVMTVAFYLCGFITKTLGVPEF